MFISLCIRLFGIFYRIYLTKQMRTTWDLIGKELLPEFLSSQDGLAKLVEGILSHILEAQVTASLGAEKHECYQRKVAPNIALNLLDINGQKRLYWTLFLMTTLVLKGFLGLIKLL